MSDYKLWLGYADLILIFLTKKRISQMKFLKIGITAWISLTKTWILKELYSFFSATTCADLRFARLRALCSSSFKDLKTLALLSLGKS